MTMPADGQPAGDGSTTPPAPAAVETPPAAPAPDAPPAGGNLPDDAEVLKAEIAKLRRENASARTQAKANAAEEARKELAQTLGKALGLVEDEQVDPAKLTEQLTAQTAAAQDAQRQLAIYQLAPAAGADPNALLDSVRFREAIKDLDLTDANAVTEAIKSAVAANASLAGSPARRAPGPNPALGSSANGTPTIQDQIADATKRGDTRAVIRLKAQAALGTSQ